MYKKTAAADLQLLFFVQVIASDIVLYMDADELSSLVHYVMPPAVIDCKRGTESTGTGRTKKSNTGLFGMGYIF